MQSFQMYFSAFPFLIESGHWFINQFNYKKRKKNIFPVNFLQHIYMQKRTERKFVVDIDEWRTNKQINKTKPHRIFIVVNIIKIDFT